LDFGFKLFGRFRQFICPLLNSRLKIFPNPAGSFQRGIKPLRD
jgi:hypothetical protein